MADRTTTLRIRAQNDASGPLNKIEKSLRDLSSAQRDFASKATDVGDRLGRNSDAFKKLTETLQRGTQQGLRNASSALETMSGKIERVEQRISLNEAKARDMRETYETLSQAVRRASSEYDRLNAVATATGAQSDKNAAAAALQARTAAIRDQEKALKALRNLEGADGTGGRLGEDRAYAAALREELERVRKEYVKVESAAKRSASLETLQQRKALADQERAAIARANDERRRAALEEAKSQGPAAALLQTYRNQVSAQADVSAEIGRSQDRLERLMAIANRRSATGRAPIAGVTEAIQAELSGIRAARDARSASARQHEQELSKARDLARGAAGEQAASARVRAEMLRNERAQLEASRQEQTRIEAAIRQVSAQIRAGTGNLEQQKAIRAELIRQAREEAQAQRTIAAARQTRSNDRSASAEAARINAAQEAMRRMQAQIRQGQRDSEILSQGFLTVARNAIRAGAAGSDAGRAAAQGGNAASRAWRAFASTVKSAGNEAAGVGRSIKAQFASIGAGFVGIYGVAQELGRIIGSFRELEAASSRLNYVFDGDIDRAADEMKYLREQTERYGLSLSSTIPEYTKFAASARGAGLEISQVRDIFEGVSSAARVNKLSTEQVNRVFVALSQSVAKNQLMQEELRGQLAEHLPGAVTLFAEAMGYASDEMADFYKAVSDGKFDASSIVEFGRFLSKTFEGSLEEAANSFEAKLNRFSTAVFEARAKIAQGGFVDAIGEGLKSMTESLKSDEGQRLIIRLADAAKALGEAFKLVASNAAALGSALIGAGYIAAFVLLKRALIGVTTSVGAMSARIAASVGFNARGTVSVNALTRSLAAYRAAAVRAGTASTVAGRAMIAMGLAGRRAAAGLGAFVGFLGGPIGAAFTAAFAVASIFWEKNRREAENLRIALENVEEAVGNVDKALQNSGETVETFREEILKITSQEELKADIQLTFANKDKFLDDFEDITQKLKKSRELQVRDYNNYVDVYGYAPNNSIDISGVKSELEALEQLDTLFEKVANGEAQVVELKKATAELFNQNIIDEKKRNELDKLADSAAENQRNHARLRDTLVVLYGDVQLAEAAYRRLRGELDDTTDSTSEAEEAFGSLEGAMGSIQDVVPGLKDVLSFNAEMVAIQNDVATAIAALNKLRGMAAITAQDYVAAMAMISGAEARAQSIAQAKLINAQLEMAGVDANLSPGAVGGAVSVVANNAGLSDAKLEYDEIAGLTRVTGVASAVRGGYPKSVTLTQDDILKASEISNKLDEISDATGAFRETLDYVVQRNQHLVDDQGFIDVVSTGRAQDIVEYIRREVGESAAMDFTANQVVNSQLTVENYAQAIDDRETVSSVLSGADKFSRGIDIDENTSVPDVADHVASQIVEDLKSKNVKITQELQFEIDKRSMEVANSEISEFRVEQLKKSNDEITKAAEDALQEYSDRISSMENDVLDAQDQAKLDQIEDPVDRARQEVLLRAQADARRDGRDLTAEELELATQLADIEAERVRLQELARTEKEAAKDSESGAKDAARASEEAFRGQLDTLQRQVDLIQERKSLLEAQAEDAKEAGDTEKFELLTGKIRELDEALIGAVEKMIAFWEASGRDESDLEIAKLESLRYEIQRAGEAADKSADRQKELASTISKGFGSAFDSMAQAIANGENAFSAFGRSVQQTLAQMLIDLGNAIVQAVIFQAIMSALGVPVSGGFGGALEATGSSGMTAQLAQGVVGLFHDGDVVSKSPKSTFDLTKPLKSNEVPAVLEAGEEVITRDDPRHRYNLQARGDRMMELFSGLARYHTGGIAGQKADAISSSAARAGASLADHEASAAAAQQGGDTKIVNVLDPADIVGQALQTREGERVMMNYVSRNREKISRGLR